MLPEAIILRRNEKIILKSKSWKKLIERSEWPVCPGTGGHFKAKWGDSLNAEQAAIFTEMPTLERETARPFMTGWLNTSNVGLTEQIACF